MNFFGNLRQAELSVAGCPYYEHTTLSVVIMSVAFYPEIVQVDFFLSGKKSPHGFLSKKTQGAMFAISMIFHQDLYLFLLSFAMLSDFFLNYGLQRAIGAAPRFPHCYDQYGTPSFAFQHMAFIDVIKIGCSHLITS